MTPATRSDLASGYQTGLYRGFLYGAMFVVAVLAVVKGVSLFI